MDNPTVKRLAIQCGIDPDFFQGGELEKFANAVEHRHGKHISICEEITRLKEQNEKFREALKQCISNCLDEYSYREVMSNPNHFINEALS